MTPSSEAATKMAEIEGRDAEYVDPLPERLNYGTGGVCLHDRRYLLQVVRELQARLDKSMHETGEWFNAHLECNKQRQEALAECAQLEARLATASDLLQEAYYDGAIWRGDRIRQFLNNDGSFATHQPSVGGSK